MRVLSRKTQVFSKNYNLRASEIAWEKDSAELGVCGGQAGGSKVGSSCWEVETRGHVQGEVMGESETSLGARG